MLFEVEHRRTTGLKLVHRLGIGRVTRLEGYNGVGKSALVRLIQVCVGQHPYPTDATLWTSFRQGVRGARVTLTGIEGANSIEWVLNPDSWQGDANGVDKLGEIRIDGATATLARVQELVDIRTILGTEDLSRTLSRQLALRSGRVRTGAGEGSELQTRLDSIDVLLRQVEVALRPLGDVDLRGLYMDKERLTSALTDARKSLEMAESADSTVSEARLVQARLDRVRDQGGDLAVKIEELDNTLTNLDAAFSNLAKDLEAAGQGNATAVAARKELSLAQKHLGRQQQRARERESDVARIVRTLQIESAGALLVKAQHALTLSQLEATTQQLSVLHAAPEVADLCEDLAARLQRAEVKGLGDETVIEDANLDISLTATQLRVLLSAYVGRLRQLPAPEEAERLQGEADALRGRLTLLGSLLDATATAAEAAQSLHAAEDRLQAAVKRVAETSNSDVTELLARREELTRGLAEAAAHRADLIRAREELGGGADEGQLMTELSAILANLEMPAEQLEAESGRTAASRQNAQDTVRGLLAEQHGVTRRLSSSEHQLVELCRVIAEDPALAWLHRAIGRQLPALDAAPPVQAEILGRLAETVANLRERITKLKQGVARGLRTLELAQTYLRSPGGESREELAGVLAWFSDVVSPWFNTEQLRTTVFEGADRITVNLADMSVAWDVEGGLASRPLSAFSSGERAFAYTRAQLATIDQEATPLNRLVVLDEFGAFIARDWQHRLEQFLLEHSRERPRDSTLLILPLTRTTEELKSGVLTPAQLEQLTDSACFTEDLM